MEIFTYPPQSHVIRWKGEEFVYQDVPDVIVQWYRRNFHDGRVGWFFVRYPQEKLDDALQVGIGKIGTL